MGIILQTFFYGVFLIIFGASMYMQWEKRRESGASANKVVLGFSILLCLLTTTVCFCN